MSIPVLKAVAAVAGCSLSSLALAGATLVQDVRVFDGKAVHERRSVLFDGGVIVDADFHGAAPPDARIVSGAGRTLLPGLIDAHTHAYRQSEAPLLFGVTTQIDMFTPVPLMQEVKRAMAAGQNAQRADMFSAGTLATAPKGHGTQFGMPIPTLSRPGEAQAFVDARIAEGSDFIKIVLIGGGLEAGGMNTLDLPTATALVEAAHRRGKLAVVHVSNEADARAMLEAGVDGLVHLFLGEPLAQARIDSLAQLARRKGAFIIPTFAVLESEAGGAGEQLLNDANLAALVDRESAAMLKGSIGSRPRQQLALPKAMTAALRRHDVPLLAGSDAGNPGTHYGLSMHREMAALVEAGLSPVDALAAATSVPASVFRLGRRGCVAAGCKADLLLVDGNPAADIKATRRIVEVWKDGQSANPLREARRALVARASSGATRQALPADGRISQFSKDKLGSPFGAGWIPSTDAFAGACDGREALALCEQLMPDIVLTDIEMPHMTGIELAQALAERKLACRVVVVTTFARSGYLRRAMEAGVRGYLLKDAPVDALADAIRVVHRGGRAIAPELALESWNGGSDPLTGRERQVLRLAGEGRSSSEIARQVHLSEGTVRNYLSEAISKLGAGNRVEAYRMARDAGWL